MIGRARSRPRRGERAVRLSVVVPVYNEEAILPELHRRIARVVAAAGDVTLELVLVDDGSSDGSRAAIARLAAADPRVRGIALDRNRGSQLALMCGVAAARGDVVCTMDADLQHPPELVPRMLEAWREGFDIVEAIRAPRAPAAGWRASGGVRDLLTPLFYRTFNLVSPIGLSPDSTDFRLLDRACVDALRGWPGELVRAMVARLDAPRTVIGFDVPPRLAGASRYDARRLGRAALSALAGAVRARLGPAPPVRGIARVRIIDPAGDAERRGDAGASDCGQPMDRGARLR